ncbi:hypothetical protein E8E12_004894 [Didymella heteroderae]|uniref:Uncharacterized protein n=1 Tax=Didymella heteroderae TaxID=1769908 RepID=A0A9P4WUL3_9PLEO|nr:hypothetical protein E8E12_004894 [Didymella heteroderae]
MAPMTSEPVNAPSRRRAFIATCSPDELLGQVIQALCPTYNIDAPHLLALRQLLASTIVAPRKPPTLKRTRPDKRIGEIGSIYDSPRRSPFGPNGPPVSANQSFYFHHQDAEFERLLPRVDRSCYVWRDEPDSQSDSDSGEEASDSQDSPQSQVSSLETPASERKVSITSVEPASTCSDEQAAAKTHPQAQEPRSTAIQRRTSSEECLFVPKSGPETPRKDAPASSLTSQPPSVPEIIITTPESTERMLTSEYENTALSSPLLPAKNVAIELPQSQQMHRVPTPPYSALNFHMPQCPDTQDTVSSTQQSEVFSPPNDFVHYTPPSQEETQQEALSQAETSSSDPHIAALKPTADPPKLPLGRSLRAFESSSPVSTVSLGKRSRGKSEASDAAPSLKRSKFQE